MDHRVVISGMGMISPLGLSVEETWQGLLAGRSAVAPIVEFSTEGFPTRMAAQVRGFDALNYLGHKDARRAGRFTQFAAAAISEAIIQSKLDMDSEDRTRVGLQIGSAIGGLFDPICICVRAIGLAVLPAVAYITGHGLDRVSSTNVHALQQGSDAVRDALVA
nr:beta-ketoacyl synthase N-terminal-like domain-containing protein [Anaerolineae bacterium]